MATSTADAEFGDGAGAPAALKPHDSKAARQTFASYFRGHRGAPLRSIVAATERRRTAACAALGIGLAEYNVRAEAFVEALLIKYPSFAAKPFARTLAFAYVSHVALFRAERAAKTAAPVEAPAPAAPLPVAQVAALAPANDVAPPPPPAPAAMPAAGAVWARLRAAGLSRFRFVGGEARNVLVRRVDPAFGFTVAVTSPADFAAVRGALEGLGLPMAERDVAGGARHFEVFAPGGPIAAAPLAPAARWPGRDNYPAYACGG